MARTTKEESLKTKQRIIDTAITLFFENGVSATTLEHIASAADMTRGAIYHHFKNKFDVVAAIHDDLHINIQNALYTDLKNDALPPLERIRRASCAFLTDILADQKQRMILSIFNFKCDYSAEMAGFLEQQNTNKMESRQIVISCFSEAQKNGTIDTTYSPEFLARRYYDYMSGIVTEHLRRNEQPFDTSTAGKTVEFFTTALLRKK